MAVRRGNARTRIAAPFVAGLLTVGLAACSATPSSPETTPPAVPTIAPTELPTMQPTETSVPQTEVPSAGPTAISAASACTVSDLKASHDLVEGAAGSRLTSVALTAASACSVDLYPAVGIRDANGAELVGSTGQGPGRIDLDPAVSYSSAVRFDNWCGPDPAFPLKLVLRIGGAEVEVTGGSFPEAGDMPPCNGGGGPSLDASSWEAAPSG